MEELDIEIDCLESKKSALQIEIIGFSEYGRYPSDCDFASIADLSNQLKLVNVKIEVLKELKVTIAYNDNPRRGLAMDGL